MPPIVRRLLGLAAFVALVLLVGAALPPRRKTTIRVLLHHSPAQVWPLIADPGRQAWRPEVTHVVTARNAAGQEIWREMGEAHVRSWKLERVEPTARMVRASTEAPLFSRERWTIELRPEAVGSELRLTRELEWTNPVARLMGLGDDPTLTLRDWAGALAHALSDTARIEVLRPN